MQNKLFSFSRNVWLTLVVLVVCTIAFFVYAWSENQIRRANDLRHQSYVLANELRQSSDDLTIMASTYVVTGDPVYKKYYLDILAIRDGKKPRPLSQSMYWDIVMANGEPPPLGNERAIPLLELMRQTGLTRQELGKLELAKANSDRLTATEFAAMRMVEAPGPVSQATRAQAHLMLHDEKYHQAKADIMKPIKEFNELMEKRTFESVHAAENIARILRVVFIGFGLTLMLMLMRTNHVLRTIMGGSVDAVYANIAKIGRGDFSPALPVPEGRRNSVLGWLEKAQTNLNKIDGELKQAKKHDQFHHQTLELLAGRDSLQGILESLVKGVEEFNPELICSVFLLDKEGKRLVNGIAPSLPDFYNAALEGLEIGMGVGSCGTAAFTGQRVIVEDIGTHPYWARFRELAARAGVRACWSQPIVSSSGKVLGTFAIYHREVHTPEESDLALIEELSRQASIAIERSIDAEKIRDSEAHYRLLTGYQRALLDNFPSAVWLKDTESRFLVVNEGFVRVFGGDSADQLVGKSDFDIAPPDLAARSRADDLDVMMSRKKKNFEEELVIGGAHKWFETYKAPVMDDKGVLLGTVGFSRDITQRKHMEHLLASMSEEFQRSVGRELHDNLGQIISAIAYQATAMQNKIAAPEGDKALSADIGFIAVQARKAIAECKKLAHGLVPFELESSGLLSALMEYAADISFAHNVACELVCHNEIDFDDANVELNIFRIVQEAVNNAVRHSGAQHVTISVSLEDNVLRVSVLDDGSGFAEPETQREASQGMGLKFMQYRANLIGATLKYNFPAAGGTEVLLEKKGFV